MEYFPKKAVKSFFNRLIADFGVMRITKKHLAEARPGGIDADLIANLQEWQASGYLRILRPIDTAAPEDVCVELLTYIEHSPVDYPTPFDPPKK